MTVDGFSLPHSAGMYTMAESKTKISLNFRGSGLLRRCPICWTLLAMLYVAAGQDDRG
jgi:hypothetical protein